MKKSQKLRVEIAGMWFIVKYADIPENIREIADSLEYQDFGLYAIGVVKDGLDEVCVKVDYYLKPGERRPRQKIKEKILGYDADELMEKQYK